MLLPGAEAHGMDHRQCLELLESTEDTLNFLTSTLGYLIHAESQKPFPDMQLIDDWNALKQEVFDVGYSLSGANVEIYKQIEQTYRGRNLELQSIVDIYMAGRF
ncbi:hypothetical protein [Pseudomonas sp. AOB-7]|uniref:hypothetical protein n=1 Tax=Pseudomonas sp. AOB-7 TaxID=2482750 RepID=UPI0011C41D40|nr:hypothetical protein [Pseudomonas sp. AOB-7]